MQKGYPNPTNFFKQYLVLSFGNKVGNLLRFALVLPTVQCFGRPPWFIATMFVCRLQNIFASLTRS